MQTTPEIALTLSADLLDRLKSEARRLGVSLASPVVDTIDEGFDKVSPSMA